MSFVKQNFSFFIILLCILPHIISISILDYIPSGDQAPQLHAAFRLANGHGLTASMDDLIPWGKKIDIVEESYTYITNWPPGFAIIISILLKIGLSLDIAAKMFQVFFILFGLYFWNKLGKKYLISQFETTIFTIIVYFAHLYLGDSNLVLWAIFPILSLFAIELKTNSTDIKQNRKILLYTSVFTSVLIVFRYQSLLLIMIFVAWILIDNKIRWRTRIINSIFFSLLPIITITTIIFINRTNGNDHFTQNINYYYYFNWVWLGWMVKAIFLETLFFDRIIVVVLNFLNLSEYISPILYIAAFGLGFVFIWLSVKIYRTLTQYRDLILWSVISLSMTILFLGIITIRLGIIGDDLVLLNVARYYKFLFPLILIIFLLGFDNIMTKVFSLNSFKLSLIIILLALSSILTYYNHSRLQFYNDRFTSVRKDVKAIKSKFEKAAAFGISVSTTELTWEDFMPCVRYFRNINNINFSKPTILFVLIEKPGKGNIRFLKDNILKEEMFYNFSYREFVTNIKMESVENKYYTIYWKLFTEGNLNLYQQTIDQN